MDQFCRGLNVKGFHGFLFVSFGCSRGNAQNTGMLSAFHFLRPEWLLLLVPAALLYLVVLRREDVSKRWNEIMPHAAGSSHGRRS